jgi:beta-lactamase class A
MTGPLGSGGMWFKHLILPLATSLAAIAVAVSDPADGPPDAHRCDNAPRETVDWARSLHSAVSGIDASLQGELGVFVLDVYSGEWFGWRAEETWYMASVVKIPIAVQVLRDIQAGLLDFSTRIELLPDDFVDGAGQTNWHPPGARLRVDFLLEQMLIASDNTASDVLIRTVGLPRVNAVAHELVAGQGGEITTLADVRRHAYSGFHPEARQLRSQDLLAIRQAGFGDPRIDRLSQAIGVPRSEFLEHDLDRVFEAFYETELNAAPISAYGRMLAAIAQGDALDEAHTRWLLDTMGRVTTGERRIKAGLPREYLFQHKTGTQHRRACDMGVVTRRDRGPEPAVVVAACTRHVGPLAESERAFRQLGEALAASGLLEQAWARSPGDRGQPKEATP